MAPVRIALVVGLLVAAGALAHALTSSGKARGDAGGLVRYPGGAGLPAAVRDAGLRFAPDTAAADRRAVETAIAGARPEARRLIALVDGVTEVRIGVTAEGAVGTTQAVAGGYAVVLNLGLASTQQAGRGIARVVLHELGHVVDGVLLTPDLRTDLDEGVPRGWGCEDGVSGACASPTERFAETFAKWASNDIGVDLSFGYRVPPPASLETWGAPLAALAN